MFCLFMCTMFTVLEEGEVWINLDLTWFLGDQVFFNTPCFGKCPEVLSCPSATVYDSLTCQTTDKGKVGQRRTSPKLFHQALSSLDRSCRRTRVAFFFVATTAIEFKAWSLHLKKKKQQLRLCCEELFTSDVFHIKPRGNALSHDLSFAQLMQMEQRQQIRDGIFLFSWRFI